MKISVAEYRAFEKDFGWPDGWWVEDCCFKINGVDTEDDEWPDLSILNDSDIIAISGGWIECSDDCGKKPKQRVYENLVKAWVKSQNVTRVVVEIDKKKLESLCAAVTSVGGKIV